MGLTNPSCTSKPCEWLPNNSVVKATKIKDLRLTRGDFGRRGKIKAELNCSPKKSYIPNIDEPCNLSFNDVLSAMKDICKEDESIIFTAETKAMQREAAPKITFHFKLHIDILRESSTQEEYLIKLSQDMSENNIAEVEKATRGQNSNNLWHDARKHVVTASRAHSVKTRMETSSKSATPIDFKNILKSVEGTHFVNEDTPALKYGREMESEAVSEFEKKFKKNHRKVKISECGLFICKDLRFVGGSPDRIVSCSCCGNRPLEVKCPFSIRHLSPLAAEAKLPFLVLDADNMLSLKRNHQYYTQCQVQMAATDLKESILFVWTPHGSHMEFNNFDVEYWNALKEKIYDF